MSDATWLLDLAECADVARRHGATEAQIACAVGLPELVAARNVPPEGTEGVMAEPATSP